MKGQTRPRKDPAPQARISSGRRFSVLALFVALGLTGYFFFRSSPLAFESKKGPYNLILISIDTVRTDALQLYNQNGAPTPSLNRISEKGHVFNDFISQVPFTLPSHCTMLTGTYPMKHLVQENTRDRLSDRSLTLAEVLKSRGFKTAGFIGAVVLASHVGIGQGFDVYDDQFTAFDIKFADLSGVQRDADEVYKSFRRWFDKKGEGRFFAFVHFYDPHAPYDPPEAFRPAERSLVSLYRGELSYVDSVIGKMFDALAQQGVWKNTILVITGDHGEMFGEHEELGHGYFVYQQALKVPLIIVLPEQQKKVVYDNPLQIVDLMPTMLDLLGVPVPREVQGQSFSPLLEGKSIPPRFAFSESLSGAQNFGTAPLRSIQDSTFKYIDTAHPELYNISSNPGETQNLIEQRKDLAAKMKAKLSQLVAAYSADSKEVGEERNLTAEEEEQFAALGYIGSSGAAPEVNMNLDAKDYIGYWNDLTQVNTHIQHEKYSEALNLIERMRNAGALPVTGQVFEAMAYAGLGKCGDAIKTLEDILSKDPENTQGLNALAECYEKVGDTGNAVKTYRRLVERQGSLIALENYARHMIALGKQEEIISYLEQMQKEGKLTDKYNEVLGEIYVKLNQPDKAMQYLRKAIENNPDDYLSYLFLSNALEKKGDKTAALKVLEGAGGRFEQPDFLVQLGLLYHRMGNPQMELETFTRMVTLHKEDARGYFYLGKALLDGSGPYDRVLELARKGLELKPSPDMEVFGTYLVADALTNLGRKDEAEPYYVKAQQLSDKGGNAYEKH
jgi:arylsulfatase A-like enzyme/tetratricopeptide (TPR) repeat protein